MRDSMPTAKICPKKHVRLLDWHAWNGHVRVCLTSWQARSTSSNSCDHIQHRSALQWGHQPSSMGSLIGWGRGRSVVSGHRPSSQRGQGDLEALETQLLKDSPCCYLLHHLQQICECLKFRSFPQPLWCPRPYDSSMPSKATVPFSDSL